MKSWLSLIWRWSWVLTLPVAVLFIYLAWVSIQYYSTFGVRYNAHPVSVTLLKSGFKHTHYLKRAFALVLSPPKNTLPKQHLLDTISLFIPESELAQLNKNLPHSGYKYVKASMLNENRLEKAKVRYRGDTIVHWDSPKKSLRVKTNKKHLYKGMRKFNVMVPKGQFTVVNHLSYELAHSLDLITPKSEMIDLIVNGELRGVHVLVEQLEELTIRENGRMPGDVYAGELFAKDKYTGINSHVFEHPGLWEKIATNNHFDDSSKRPLEELIHLINQPPSEEVLKQLEHLIDIEAWGRFSAFETLAQTYHFDLAHNWRIYYDPWKAKFVPIVWDPIGWVSPSASKLPIASDISRTRLHKALFKSSAFLIAKQNAVEMFFSSGADHQFLAYANELIEKLKPSIEADPYIKVSPKKKIAALIRYKKRIERVFSHIESEFTGGEGGLEYTELDDNGTKIGLLLSGRLPVKSMSFIYRDIVTTPLNLEISYWVAEEKINVDISGAVSVNGNKVIVDTDLVANFSSTYRPDIRIDVQNFSKAYYELQFSDSNSNNELQEVLVDRGTKFFDVATYKAVIAPLQLNNLYFAVKPKPITPFDIWSGQHIVTGVQHVYNDVIIKAGTAIKLAANASLIFHGRLVAEGTKNAPILFGALEPNQSPWGTVAIQGAGANGSSLQYCEFSEGSGYKDVNGMFEYSSMFSIHEVHGAEVTNSKFRDSKIVDDMVHAVYSDVKITNSTFTRSLSDALDIDISKAELINNVFIDSGNDAIDLMTSDAVILGNTITGSSDKGVSVGEGSRLLAINTLFSNNGIAVQSKDGSTATLYNVDIENNAHALDAYKKNWRYNSGGNIYIYKSRLLNNKKMITADKKSTIYVYDSYHDKAIRDDRKKPRVRLHKTVSQSDIKKSKVKKLWRYPKEVQQMNWVEDNWWSFTRPEVRGSSEVTYEN